MSYGYEPHLFTLCWIILIGGVFLTINIIQKPCEGPKQAIVFYLMLPILTLLAMASLPYAYYKMIQVLWTDELKKERLRVKKR